MQSPGLFELVAFLFELNVSAWLASCCVDCAWVEFLLLQLLGRVAWVTLGYVEETGGFALGIFASRFKTNEGLCFLSHFKPLNQ